MSGLFNTIGEKADKIAPATISNNQNGDAPEEDEKVVDEIESLCMNCEENVSRRSNPALQLILLG
jgi:zinc finger protein